MKKCIPPTITCPHPNCQKDFQWVDYYDKTANVKEAGEVECPYCGKMVYVKSVDIEITMEVSTEKGGE